MRRPSPGRSSRPFRPTAEPAVARAGPLRSVVARQPSKKPSRKPAITADPESLAAVPTAARDSSRRPGFLSDILGQDKALAALGLAMSSSRLHHAWIFHGPPGVGKFTAALAFAAAILDPTMRPGVRGVLPEVDRSGRVRRLCDAGSHPDLHVITKELARYSDDPRIRAGKQITIAKDVIDRHLIQPATLAPAITPGGLATKVFIVDEAELLDRSPYHAPTQNSILKTLEEPSPGTVIILVTSAEDRLLPTIRSRCQRVGFGRLDPGSMNEWIRRAGVALPSESASWLLEYADGSPGDLLKSLATGVDRWREQIGPMLGRIERGESCPELGGVMAELIEAEAERLTKASSSVSKEASNKAAADAMFRLVADHLRRGLRASASASPPAVRPARARIRCMELLSEAERHVDANVQAIFACSNLSAQMGLVMAATKH